jgi:RNA 3'-terminal phosphate cyclase-like protein
MSTKARRAGSEAFSPLLNEFKLMAFHRSPGYALSLVAESTTAALHCAEAVSQPGVAPEDIALQATRSLLNEIERGGCVDQKHQTLVLLLMALGSEDVGRCRMAEPTERT